MGHGAGQETGAPGGPASGWATGSRPWAMEGGAAFRDSGFSGGRRLLLLLVQVVLGDRAGFALFRYDNPGGQVHQRCRARTENGQCGERDADDVGVDPEELPDARTDPRDHPSFPGADQLLVVIRSVHSPIMPRRRAPSQPSTRPRQAQRRPAVPPAADTEERLVRDTVRAYTTEKVMPHIADWFEAGVLPRELAPELGKMGLLGMHLSGYGCAGMGPVAYGVACRELEAADTGLRSLVSVQGSLAMYPIWRYGSDEQKEEWLPRMAAGEAIGCFGLTEPDHGSDPASMKTTALPNGSGWVLSGSKMWITNGTIADVAVVWARTPDGIRGFLVPRGARGFTTRSIHKKMSLRASVTAELNFDEVKLPADAMLPGVSGLKGPLSCLTEARFGIAWGVLGSARSCLETAVEYARTREQFGRPIGGFQLT